MPNMLFDGGVEYADGTEATVEQQARDVTEFLAWASEPNMEDRKQMGVKVVLFLIVFTGLDVRGEAQGLGAMPIRRRI